MTKKCIQNPPLKPRSNLDSRSVRNFRSSQHRPHLPFGILLRLRGLIISLRYV
ncbi:hypothetical protein OROHE_014331 [Orobanche hederae]